MSSEIKLNNVGKLIINDRCLKIIDYLHHKIGATEWSGMLFFKLISGNIKNKKDLIFEATFIYPRDIGNATYTETEASGDIAEAYNLYESGIEEFNGLIHTHHQMSAFFSSTDINELTSNAKLYNFYLSLIVNFDGKYCAKVAFPGKEKSQSVISYIDENGDSYETLISEENDIIAIGDLTIEYNKEIPHEDWMDSKIEELQKKKDAKVKTSSIYQPKNIPFRANTNDLSNGWFNNKAFSKGWSEVDDLFPEDIYAQNAYTNIENERKPFNPKEFLLELIDTQSISDCNTTDAKIKSSFKDNIDNKRTCDNNIDIIDSNLELVYEDIVDDLDFTNFKSNMQLLIDLLITYNEIYGKTFFYTELYDIIKFHMDNFKN